MVNIAVIFICSVHAIGYLLHANAESISNARSLNSGINDNSNGFGDGDTITFSTNATFNVSAPDGCSKYGDCKGLKMLAHLTPQDLGWEDDIMCTDLWGWTDKRKTPYRNYIVICCETGYSIIDVTSPSTPKVIGSLKANTGGKWRWRSVKIYKNYAYFVSDALMSRVQILNLEDAVDTANGRRQLLRGGLIEEYGQGSSSNDNNNNSGNSEDSNDGEISLDPNNIRTIKSLKTTTTYTGGGIYQSHNIVINEDSGYAYAVGGGNNCNTGLHMIDIRDPANPTFAGCFYDPENQYIHDAQCVTYDDSYLEGKYKGREICFGFAVYNLLIIDVTNKSNVKLLSRIGWDGAAYIHQGWLTEDRHFLIVDDERDDPGVGIKTTIVDVRNLDNPKIAHFHIALGETFADHNQYLIKIGEHEYTVQANYNGGIRVLRIVRGPVVGKSDDEIIALEEVAFFDTNPKSSNVMDGVWSAYPYFESDKLIITSDMETGIFILTRTFDDNAEAIPYANGIPTESPTPWTDCPKIKNQKACLSQIACVWSMDWEAFRGWFSGCYNALPAVPEKPYRAPPGGASSCNGFSSDNCKKYPACIWRGGRCSVYND